MENQAELLSQGAPNPLRRWGFWAIIVGAIALMLVFVQIIGPSFESKPSAATQIGEIAGEIKRSAWRSFFGLPNESPQKAATSLWSYVALAAPALGIAAIVLSAISGVMRENWRYSVYGTGFGVAAVLFHYFWWLALVIAGIALLIAIIENIGDIFSLS